MDWKFEENFGFRNSKYSKSNEIWHQLFAKIDQNIWNYFEFLYLIPDIAKAYIFLYTSALPYRNVSSHAMPTETVM